MKKNYLCIDNTTAEFHKMMEVREGNRGLIASILKEAQSIKIRDRKIEQTVPISSIETLEKVLKQYVDTILVYDYKRKEAHFLFIDEYEARYSEVEEC